MSENVQNGAPVQVLIVEDELLVRVGLKTIIPWEEYGLVVIGECASAQEAVRLIETTPPHIMLLDIKLKDGSGLDILRMIREKGLRIRTIVISSWDDLQTVKHAMQLGAHDYIHKPQMHVEELLETVLKMCAEIKMEQSQSLWEEAPTQHRKFSPEERLGQMIENPDAPLDAGEMIELFGSGIARVLAFSIFHMASVQEEGAPTGEVANKAVANLLREFTATKKGVYYTPMGNGCHLLLVNESDGSALQLNDKVNMFIRAVDMLIKRLANASVVYGMSNTLYDKSMMRTAIQQAAEAHQRYFWTGSRVNHPYGAAQPKQGTHALQATTEKMRGLLQQGDITKHLALLPEFEKQVRESQPIGENKILHLLNGFLYFATANDMEYCEDAILNMEKCRTLAEMLAFYQMALQNWSNMRQQTASSSSTNDSIMAYVNHHYAEDLSLQTLSEQLHLSPNYISRIFKRETGENLSTYINKVRIEKAKTLLAETDFRICEIAEKTGFKSAVNFNYVFSRIQGDAPSQYKKKIREICPEERRTDQTL